MFGRQRARYRTSEKLFAASSRILPGGVDSPVRAFKSVGGTPIFVERARGAYLEDVDGNSYIDYVMSWGPLIHGHAPKGLLKALAAAARKGTSFGAPTELETRLARRVAMLMPSMERVRFVSSGTEAAMSALRVARAATRREQDHQVRRLLSRSRRLVPRPGGIGRDDAGSAHEPGGARGRGGGHDSRALQRSRLRRTGVSPGTRGRSPASSSSRLRATWASWRRETAFCRAFEPSAIERARCSYLTR